jgi:hypothetical protein
LDSCPRPSRTADPAPVQIKKARCRRLDLFENGGGERIRTDDPLLAKQKCHGV